MFPSFEKERDDWEWGEENKNATVEKEFEEYCTYEFAMVGDRFAVAIAVRLERKKVKETPVS